MLTFASSAGVAVVNGRCCLLTLASSGSVEGKSAGHDQVPSPLQLNPSSSWRASRDGGWGEERESIAPVVTGAACCIGSSCCSCMGSRCC